jgi:hypothetical protein
VQTVILLKLDGRDELSVRWNGVDAAALAQIPDLAGVIFTGAGQMVAVRRAIHTEDALEMTFHEHDAAASAEIPHSTV